MQDHCSVQTIQERKFTCYCCHVLLLRALHLELTDSTSMIDCMLAIRKFIACWGLPTAFYSDNVKTFVSVTTELQKVFGHHSPRWRFIVPRSLWWGGFWERLIGSVKSGLKKSLGVRYLCKKEMESVLTEIEACINSRPLTYVSDETDLPHFVSPPHFLLGRTTNSQPSCHHEVCISWTLDISNKTWRHLRHIPLILSSSVCCRQIQAQQ